MKQTFTLHKSFSGFFSNGCKPAEATLTEYGMPTASAWVLKNLLAYSAALFVAKTKLTGNTGFILN